MFSVEENSVYIGRADYWSGVMKLKSKREIRIAK